MSCPFHNAKLRDGLPPLPENMKSLPIDERGYPVPWFVPWIDGKPEFLMADGSKLRLALANRICWVCGKPLPALGKPITFVIGPMCVVNRITAEPPNHLECAEFSAKGCPFLSKPQMTRRENENTERFRSDIAGIMIERNPGVTCVYSTKKFQLVSDGKGKKLIELGEPVSLSWWKEGRPATRAEVMHSIDTGLPLLREMCFSADDHAHLTKQIERAKPFLPT